MIVDTDYCNYSYEWPTAHTCIRKEVYKATRTFQDTANFQYKLIEFNNAIELGKLYEQNVKRKMRLIDTKENNLVIYKLEPKQKSKLSVQLKLANIFFK